MGEDEHLHCEHNIRIGHACYYCTKVQVGKDQEKAQSEKDSHSKTEVGRKTKLTIRYHENIS